MAGQAFGRSLQELAAAGRPPAVLLDSLRWLAARALTVPGLFFSGASADRKKVAQLKALYDAGRRPLRTKSSKDKDPATVSSLLLLWLTSLPEPLLPAELVPALVESQQTDCFEDRLAGIKAVLKRTEPFIVEALFPLFETLHHHWLNHPDREASLQQLGRRFAPVVLGQPRAHGLAAEDAGLLVDAVELMISEYRPLFTQPFNLRRFEEDLARQQAAAAAGSPPAAARGSPVAVGTAADPSSPLLTPVRVGRLSVFEPPASPYSEAGGTPFSMEGSSPPGWEELSPPGADWGSSMGSGGGWGSPGGLLLDPHAGGGDPQLDSTLSSLLEATICGCLFFQEEEEQQQQVYSPPALRSAPAKLAVSAAEELPASPMAVVPPHEVPSDQDSGSDCEGMAGHLATAFAWAPGQPASMPAC